MKAGRDSELRRYFGVKRTRLLPGLKWGAILLLLASVSFPNSPQDTKGGISGRVLAEDGNGIENMWVGIGNDIPELSKRLSRDVLTEKDGSFRFSGLPLGRYRIVVTNNPHGSDPNDLNRQVRPVNAIDPETHAFFGSVLSPSLVEDVEITAGAPRARVDFRLVKGARIRGVIAFSDKKPAQGVRVRSVDGWGTTAVTDEAGKYSIKGLRPGNGGVQLRWVLENDQGQFLQEARKTIQGVPLKSGETTELRSRIFPMDAETLSLSGDVSIDGIPFKSSEKDRIEAKGVRAGAPSFHVGVRSEDSSVEIITVGNPTTGRYRLCSVPPGKYEFMVTFVDTVGAAFNFLGGPISNKLDISVEKGKPIRIDVELLTGEKPKVRLSQK